MSGKQAKESRRIKANVDKHFKTVQKAMVPGILKAYREGIQKLPLRKRLVVCYKILTGRFA